MGCFAGAVAKWYYGADVKLPSLAVPEGLTTTSLRPWRVPLEDLPPWARFAAIVPGFMVSLLLCKFRHIAY